MSDHAAIISFETSGNSGGTALLDLQGQVICEINLEEDMRHGRGLTPAAAKCLSKAAQHKLEIIAVTVDTGPGSYTGLRVGVMAAKAFAYAKELPIYGIDACSALAWEVRNQATTIAIIISARPGEVYYATFNPTPQKLTCSQDIILITPEEAIALICKLPPQTALAGSGQKQLDFEKLQTKMPQLQIITTPLLPSAAAVSQLGLRAYKKNPKGEALHNLQPIYPRRQGINQPILGEKIKD